MIEGLERLIALETIVKSSDEEMVTVNRNELKFAIQAFVQNCISMQHQYEVTSGLILKNFELKKQLKSIRKKETLFNDN